MLKDVKVGLFISGGIAAYKMAELSRQLIKQGAQVRVAMTESAQEFITPLTMQTLTKHRVLVDTFDEENPQAVQHIELADWIDIALVAPATANLIGKMAQGIGDEIVSTTLFAIDKPRVIVPAMNTKMYDNPANQRNLETLKDFGYHIMEPETGFLAEGYSGKGRLPELERIVNLVVQTYWRSQYPQLLAGKKVLVSAGGTVEAMDPVRYISNRSSGTMGYAMAQGARLFGADVILVSTRPNLRAPEGVEVKVVDSARDMLATLEGDFSTHDYLVMAAAVSDYRVGTPSDQKMKKDPSQEGRLQLELVENPDILATLAQGRQDQTLIGFAAETEKVAEYAQAKLVKKDIHWIIANDVSGTETGFDSAENKVMLFNRQGESYNLPQDDKYRLAVEIWKIILDVAEENKGVK